jgi:hypothetical protein
MKSLIGTLFLITTFSAFGSDLGAVDSMLSILPIGTHIGQTDAGDRCSVVVNEVNFPDKVISITAIDNKNKVFKIIADGSDFLFRAHKSEFIQTDRFYVNANRNSYVERVIRTFRTGHNRLYVAVAHETTVNREVSTESVECVVSF